MTSKSSLSKPITNIILAATIIATLKQCQVNHISIQIQSCTIRYYAPSTVKEIILAMKIIIHIIHGPILKDYGHHEDDNNVQAVPVAKGSQGMECLPLKVRIPAQFVFLSEFDLYLCICYSLQRTKAQI